MGGGARVVFRLSDANQARNSFAAAAGSEYRGATGITWLRMLCEAPHSIAVCQGCLALVDGA